MDSNLRGAGEGQGYYSRLANAGYVGSSYGSVTWLSFAMAKEWTAARVDCLWPGNPSRIAIRDRGNERTGHLPPQAISRVGCVSTASGKDENPDRDHPFGVWARHSTEIGFEYQSKVD